MEIVKRDIEKDSSIFGKRKGKEREAYELRNQLKVRPQSAKLGMLKPGQKGYQVQEAIDNREKVEMKKIEKNQGLYRYKVPLEGAQFHFDDDF